MKEVILVGSYCDTSAKIEALERLLAQASELGLPTIVFGRYPIPERLQRLCDYWIYDKSNPVMLDRALNHWLRVEDKIISNFFFDYGYPALEQIVKTLGFAKNLNYEIAHWLGYDVDLSGFSKFRDESLAVLSTTDSIATCVGFRPVYPGPIKGINTTSITFRVGEAYDRLRGVLTQTFYRKLINLHGDFIAEDLMEECFNVSELKYTMLPEEIAPVATLTSTGIRKHGDIPEQFVKTKQYLTNFFVGHSPENDSVTCYFWGMQTPISQVKVDFGTGSPTVLDVKSGSACEFQLNFTPTRCKILEINSDQIDEELDSGYSAQYWDMNKIESSRS
jgi:hypothetical protein